MIKNSHYRRDSDGRFVVRLPFKDLAKVNGDSRGMAEKRLRSMERRFERDKDLRLKYAAFMKEYKTLGHMVEINVEQDQ